MESIHAVNEEKTLYETAVKDLWQMRCKTLDGQTVGRVIRQVIEPQMYTIRYFVVYQPEADRHFLIPSNTIKDIAGDEVCCDLDIERIKALPAFKQRADRQYEETIYKTLGRKPYWVEEAAVRGTTKD